MKNIIFLFALLTLSAMSCTHQSMQTESTNKNEISGDLIIFHAGSLSVPFKEMADSFKVLYPKVNVILEAAGSVKCARKITDLHLDCDIMASADYAVIDKFLIPQYADWNLPFAVNEMSIVFNSNSRHANEIDSTNWYKILLKKDVAYGRSDPNSDPCGYRTVLTSKLAEKYYKLPNFSSKLLAKDTKHIRPKEVDLLALLEVKSIDYIFLYKSVALQHNLKYLVLPDKINLKNNDLAELYAQFSVEINGKTPSEKELMIGEPMLYGITAIKNSPNPKAKIAFIDFVLSEKGKAIMKKNGQETPAPMPNKNYNLLPNELQKYALKLTN